MKEELQKSCFSFSTVKKKNEKKKTSLITELISIIFIWLMTKIKDSVQKLTEHLMLKDHLLLALLKLGLELCERDLVYRFKEPESTILNILM